MMGMGPINITPPVLTSPVLEAVPCRMLPMNIRMNPMKIAIIPAIIIPVPLIMIYINHNKNLFHFKWNSILLLFFLDSINF